jgi:hypothetical protein
MRRPAAPGSHSTRLIDAFFAELTDHDLEQLESMLATRRQTTATAAPADRWLDSTQAAEYLGLSRASLHKLTAACAIQFEQDGPGCRCCWFLRSDLDAYRRGTSPHDAAKTLPRSTSTRLRAA